MKSQNVSCAVDACGISTFGSGLKAWTRSGNLKQVDDVVQVRYLEHTQRG
jgi:hypothetical protein